MTDYEFHPLADLFPLMGQDDLAALAADIQANGLGSDIVIHEGKILDGRNRYLACKRVGVKPTFTRFDPTYDPLAFVLSVNLHRRHLTPEQRQQAKAERQKRVMEKRAEGKSLRAIADEEGVSHVQIARDLEDAGESGVTYVTPENEKVTGRDGKEYPSRRPDPEPDDRSPSQVIADLTPRPSSSRPLPPYFKPGSNTDPDHPYAELMNKVSALGATITRALNDADDPNSEKLLKYLCYFGLAFPRDKIVDGKHKGHIFTGFRNVRYLIKLAGKPGKEKTKQQLQKGLEEEDDE